MAASTTASEPPRQRAAGGAELDGWGEGGGFLAADLLFADTGCRNSERNHANTDSGGYDAANLDAVSVDTLIVYGMDSRFQERSKGSILLWSASWRGPERTPRGFLVDTIANSPIVSHY